MLTDIFANRYPNKILRDSYSETDSRLLVQGFRLIVENVYPYWWDKKENDHAKAKLAIVHDRLSRELGLKELSPITYFFHGEWHGKPHTYSGTWTMDKVCENFVCAKYNAVVSADRFIKERISFFELTLRHRGEEIEAANKKLPADLVTAKIRDKELEHLKRLMPATVAEGVKAANERLNNDFRAHVHELNERFRQAGYPLNYHNGFVQFVEDPRIEQQLEAPFWGLVGEPRWKNVDTDMKEAVDRRDNSDRDPAFYAARALESAIKIISDDKGWTHGGEKGAHNYIDNLGSAKNAFIAPWEREVLKRFFTEVRNPMGHGPGNEPMPALTPQQTNWAIETCMSWIKALVQRL